MDASCVADQIMFYGSQRNVSQGIRMGVSSAESSCVTMDKTLAKLIELRVEYTNLEKVAFSYIQHKIPLS